MEKIQLGNIEFNTEKLRIQSSKSLYCDSFYFEDLFNEQQYRSFIKSTKALIRKSSEYNKYIQLLRSEVDALNKDAIQSNINDLHADLEFHHYPLTLEDIVVTVMNKHIINNKKFTTFSISKEIMEYHFKHQIGLVSLSKTNHQLTHSGAIFLNKKQIFGNYEKFLEENEKGLSSEIKSKLLDLEKFSEENISADVEGIYDDIHLSHKAINISKIEKEDSDQNYE